MAYLDLNGLRKHIELTKAYVNGKLAHYISQEQLSPVAVSGSYNDLTDTPEVLSDEAIEAKIKAAIEQHDSSSDAHTNLFQIVSSGETPIGLDDGGIYFELDITKEPDINMCGIVFGSDSTNMVTCDSDLIKIVALNFYK